MVRLLTRSENFSRDLLSWFDREGRDLPWRRDSNPYGRWISEVMLQQTRVATVIPYYIRFMETIPSIKALAQVEEEQLLKLWQGLGYYSRARNLKKAAMIIMESYGGQVPRSYDELVKLPGIGPYTAGAIASMAYGQKKCAVDGNVFRIIARLTLWGKDIKDRTTKNFLTEVVEELLPEDRPGEFNQALMDLGAMYCLPKGEPLCEGCPVGKYCQAYLEGKVLDIPKVQKRKSRKVYEKTILVIRSGEQIVLEQGEETGLLANMWGLPHLEGHQDLKQLQEILNKWGVEPIKIDLAHSAKHIFSHQEWHMVGYTVYLKEQVQLMDWVWASKDEIVNRYSIPTAYRPYLESLNW